MKLKLISMALGAILATGGGSLGAQDFAKGWSVSGGLGLGADGLDEITNTGTWSLGAYNLDLGYTGKLAATTVPFRASIGYNYLPDGKKHDATVTHSLGGYYVAADLFLDTKVVDALQLFVGISLNRWSMTEKYLLATGDDEKEKTLSVPGYKFGGRIGLEYKFSNQLSFNAVFQMIELGHSHLMVDLIPDDAEGGHGHQMSEAGPRPWNPSWLQIGVKFSF